jgi:hypothetical protein
MSVLTGPALWVAKARDDKLAEWRVYEDTPTNRFTLDIDGHCTSARPRRCCGDVA